MSEPSDPTPDPLPSDPTLLGHIAPDELFARAMNTVKMTSSGGGPWQPPSIAETAQLFPGYEVLQLLGRGGMGAVYQARQIALDRLVALKLLPLEVSVDPSFADRFRREARAMARLHHPNIITVFDFGTTREGHLFFVMEYVEGANLQDVIRQAGLNDEQALAIVEQICTALAYAHGKGIVHRDIKPANVMLDTESHVKVADFGLARLTDPTAEQMGHTMTGTVMGTPDYMAPEQMEGMDVDHRADIYSLGVMLYEMLCRQVPKGIFQPPSHRTGCDARIDQIVIRAMQQAPDHRYQSTTEMKADVIAARVPLTMFPSGPTQQVHPRPVADVVGQAPRLPGTPAAAGAAALQSPKAAVMKAIAPTATAKKSKVPFYAALAASLAVIATAAFLVPKLQLGHAPAPRGSASPAPDEAGASPTSASPSGSLGTRDVAGLPALEPGAIRLWDSPEKVPKGRDTLTWKDNALFLTNGDLIRSPGDSRDLLLRFSVRLNDEADALKIAIRSIGTPNEPRKYQLQITPKTRTIIFRLEVAEDPRTLQKWVLPSPRQGGDWLPIELRASAGDFTISADGEVLGTVHDETIGAAGRFLFSAAANGYFRDIVYVPLDLPAVVAPASPPAEPWQDVLHDPAKLTLFRSAERTAEGLRLGTQDTARCTRGEKPPRNGAIRMRTTLNGVHVQLFARNDSTAGAYLLSVFAQRVRLTRYDNSPAKETTLHEFALREPLPLGQPYTLEFRVVGPVLTVKLNDEVLGTVTDSTLSTGDFAVRALGSDTAATSALITALEVLDLDTDGAAGRDGSPSRPGALGESALPGQATLAAPFVNSLGMRFVPVPITGGPTGGQRVLFSIWETRVQDYAPKDKEDGNKWTKPDLAQGLTHPAVNVSWHEARAFCDWLTLRERRAGKIAASEAYRLPSDHEWSCAVGLGGREDPALVPKDKDALVEGIFPWGGGWPPPEGAGNYAGQEAAETAEQRPNGSGPRVLKSYRDGFPETAPVGSFPANALGLHDLGGNVWEWCEDWHDAEHRQRLLRGAAWRTYGQQLLLASKRYYAPASERRDEFGFRVVLAPVAP